MLDCARFVLTYAANRSSIDVISLLKNRKLRTQMMDVPSRYIYIYIYILVDTKHVYNLHLFPLLLNDENVFCICYVSFIE